MTDQGVPVWREVSEKEFADFVLVLGLQPIHGYSNNEMNVTYLGAEESSACASVETHSSGRRFKIFQSAGMAKQVDA